MVEEGFGDFVLLFFFLYNCSNYQLAPDVCVCVIFYISSCY